MKKLAGINILYEDNHLLAVVKPVGLAVQGGPGIKANLLDQLKDGLKKRESKAGEAFLALVHRLDQPVGGVLLLAKTSKAAARMAAMQRDHQLDKYYYAITQGIPADKEGRLEDRLKKDRQNNQSRVLGETERSDKNVRSAVLHYRILGEEKAEQLALLEVKLDTGRSHQIRVQLAHAGWPLWGDYRYNRRWARKPAGDTVALWSACLRFSHPIKHEMIELRSKPEMLEPWVRLAEYFTEDSQA